MYSDRHPSAFSSLLESMNTIRLTVVREGADLLDHEPAATYSLSAATDTEVRMLPEKACIFLVDADDILHHDGLAVVSNICPRLATG